MIRPVPEPRRRLSGEPVEANPLPPMQRGWECPKCGTVMAPWKSTCANCKPSVTSGPLMGERGVEGVVWHHPDGRMAKLKVRDFA